MTHGTYGGPLESTYAGALGAAYGGESHDAIEAGVAQASTYGGEVPGTYGAPLPATYDDPTRTREPERLEGSYALTLLNGDNERLVIDNVMSMSAERRRSAVNSLALSVPYADNELGEWRFAEAILTFDERVLFRGEVREVTPDSSTPATDLTIYGPSYSLQAGDITVTYDGVKVKKAIQDFWENYTEFTYTVTTESGRGEPTLEEEGFSGTPLEIINELHEFGGYHWYVDVTKPDRAYSFPKSHSVRNPTIQSIGSGYQPSWDTTEYYNHVVVRGNGVKGEAEAVDEIDNRGRHTYPANEDLDTVHECQSRAETLLEEHLTNDQLSGSVEMVPRALNPGTALVIDEWDNERRVGPYSLFFDGEGSHVTLPPESLEEAYSGSISMWTKGEFSKATHRPHLFTGEYQDGDSGTFRITDTHRLTFRIGGQRSVVSVDAYPDGDIPRDEWIFVHFSWEYDSSNNRTTVKAGHDGEILSEGGFTGKLAPPTESLTLGRYGNRHFEGYIDDVRIYSEPLSEARYTTLAQRDEIPATNIKSRWAFNEGAFVDHERVIDVIRGHDGTRHGVEYRGNPLPVEQVSYTESMGEFSMSVDLEKTDDWALDLAQTQADIRTMRKYE